MALVKTAAVQERIDILLALAIAHCRQQNHDQPSESFDCTQEALNLLSALNQEDLTLLRQRTAFYKELPDEEKETWKAHALSRVKNRNYRLDKDIHYTNIAEVLRREPAYIINFILRNLSAELRQNIAQILDLSHTKSRPPKTLASGLEKLLRRQFLSNFVSRDDLNEIKPLVTLSGGELLELLQRLGHFEIGLVCRGIKNIEDLAPFLRQFPAPDAQAIVKIMTSLQFVEQKRIEAAENTVHEAWQSQSDSTLVVQQIGLKKLAASFAKTDEAQIRFTTQKLPLKLVNKLREFQTANQMDQDFIENAVQEVEKTAAQILLDKNSEKTVNNQQSNI